MRVFFSVCMSALFWSTVASSFCYEPSMILEPPRPPQSYEEPTPPYCLSGYSITGKHNCDEWEIQNYIDEVNAFIEELQNFVDNANEYAEAADSFSSEAYSFAKCKAAEITSPLN